MPFIEITEEQEKILTEAEFACLVSDRNNIMYEIKILSETQRMVDWRQGLASGLLCIEIASRQKQIKDIDEKLSVLRKKLGIETPVDNSKEL
jgi:hypothetical protein